MFASAAGRLPQQLDAAPVKVPRFRAVDEHLLQLRRRTYALFLELGRAPTAAEAAASLVLPEAEVRAGWEALHDAHALVLDIRTRDIRMANPLSAFPTRYLVRAGGREWFANCGWDAFGICAALHTDGSIESECPDCGEAIHIEVRNQQPDTNRVVFHCLVPARQWWEDIVFT